MRPCRLGFILPYVDEPLAKLTDILLNAFYSFLNLGLFLGEMYLALKFVDEIKLEAAFKKVTPLVRFVLALVMVSLASSLLNSFLNKYLSALLGVNPPLAKILQALEALVFFAVLYLFYRRGRKK